MFKFKLLSVAQLLKRASDDFALPALIRGQRWLSQMLLTAFGFLFTLNLNERSR